MAHGPDGRARTGYKYDVIGRPVLRAAQGAADAAKVVVASWVYDQNGRYGTLSTVTGGTVNPDAYSESYQYDALLRPTKVAIHMPPVGNAAARDFAVGYGYDQNYGRVKARSYPSGQLVAFDYDDRGYALGEIGLLADGSRGTLYRRVNAMSVRGQVTDQTLGNHIVETAQYDASTGLSTWASSTRPPGTAATCKTASGTARTPLMLVRQMRYQYDQFLNLASQQKTYYRRDAASGFPDCTSGAPVAVAATESYSSDDLQRLLGSARTWTDDASLQADSYAYDDLGNITQKSDFGSEYTYGMSPRGAELAGPHAVASIQKTDGTTATYTYDSNGNLVRGDGRTITFDRNDQPVRVAMGAVTTEFYYSPDGSRYAQHETGSADGARTVFYVDKDYELVAWDGGAIEERSYVGPSVVIYRRDSKPAEVRYRHGDRLNSLDAVTDAAGNEIATDLHGYDAFGKPRGYDWRPNQGAAFERLHASEVGVTTNDGFTTHEHLDEVYLIHMNGRVYDYRMGRFLSVDPIISNPANSQAINPYSYIGNNPLSGVDPTGYCEEAAQTGTHICGADTIGNLTINGDPALPGSGSLRQSTSGAVGQGAKAPSAPLADGQSPSQNAKNIVIGLVAWEGQRFLSSLPDMAKLGTGLAIGTMQGLVPFAGSYNPPSIDGDFDLGRKIGLEIGGGAAATVGGGMSGAGLALGGFGLKLALPTEGGAALLEVPAGVLVAVGGVLVAGGTFNVEAAQKIQVSAMRNSGGDADGVSQGGAGAPAGAAKGGSSSETTGRTTHGDQRAAEAAAGDVSRQVGDGNRVLRQGRHFVDTETGANVHVDGNRVVITNGEGKVVTQFRNSRANTQERIQSGKWKPSGGE